MPLKTSKRPKSRPSQKKEGPGFSDLSSALCSESEVQAQAFRLSKSLKLGERVFLEGPLGAGKSTFARYLLEGLRIDRPSEGSPTFPLIHEYRAELGAVCHIDLYRIRTIEELDQSGIVSVLWERPSLALIEWVSLWPKLRTQLLRQASKSGSRIWEVELGLCPEQPAHRTLKITRLS